MTQKAAAVIDQEIDRYIDILKRENDVKNLYSKKSYDHLDFHIKDCLKLANLLHLDGGHVLDMGSGAGLPSVILAIANPSMTVTAVESRRKRTVFLEQVRDDLELANLDIRNMDVNQFIRETDIIPTAITAKAFAPYDKVISISNAIAQSGTTLWIPISNMQFDVLSHVARDDFDLLDENGFYYLKKAY